MNTLEISKLLSTHPVTAKVYVGTFPSDMMPRCILKRPAICVANSDPHNLGGQHWLGFYLSDVCDDVVDYFDSYGNKPSDPTFISFLQRNGDVCVYNNKLMQDFTTDSCGMFVCLFLLFRCLGYSHEHFQRLFTRNLKSNEIIVSQLFTESFRNTVHISHLPLIPSSTEGCFHLQRGK